MTSFPELAALVTIIAIIAGAATALVRHVHYVSMRINDRIDKRIAELHKRVDDVAVDITALREAVVRVDAIITEQKTMIDRASRRFT